VKTPKLKELLETFENPKDRPNKTMKCSKRPRN
jgi:hypothetical protein